jgi:hypothetical protein
MANTCLTVAAIVGRSTLLNQAYNIDLKEYVLQLTPAGSTKAQLSAQ